MIKRKTAITILALGICASIHGPARAERKKELAPPSAIDRVMVYYDRALVTRVAPCGVLEPGLYEILFGNMPAFLADESVRARALGPDVKILDVEVRALSLEKSPEKLVQDERDQLQRLEDEKSAILDAIRNLNGADEYLNGVRESFLGVPTSPVPGRNLGMRYQDRLGIGDYDRMLSYLKSKRRENSEQLQRETKKLRTVDRKISLAREKLGKTQGTLDGLARKKFVKATVEVLRRGKLDMEISYINRNVSWKPGYDIRVFPDEKKTEFTGYGIVSQSSGEDWMNSGISFSTAQPAVRGYLPELVPVYATLSSKMPRRPTMKRSGGYASQRDMNKMMLDNIVPSDSTRSQAGEDIAGASAADQGAPRRVGSLVFQVPKRADIPGDGSAHRTPISRHTLPVRFEYVCTPKISPYAYLQGVGKNTLDTPILRGDLNIFMGNDFVGSSYTDNILPGEDFELVLSVNENIRVTRSLEEMEEKEGGFLSGMKKTDYRFLVKVENFSGSDILINVFDQVPVSRTSEIEIRDVVFSHAPQTRDAKGICKWQFSMKSRDTVNLSFSFSVAVPRDKEAAFFRTKLSPSVYLDQLSTGTRTEFDLDEEQSQPRAPAMRMKQH